MSAPHQQDSAPSPRAGAVNESRREWAIRLVAEESIPEPNTGCYLWLGYVRKGYAFARFNGRATGITRALLGLTDRRILACHTCDTPSCVNEQHLFIGTTQNNTADAKRKGRMRRALCYKGHPLTPDNVFRPPSDPERRDCLTCLQARRRARNDARRIGGPRVR